ncbi:hypothetical protein AGMMS49942_04830 [Spirochaetia bacterium]|nr:hypothetical protein AGMMS49942_04830 [Spirochaetia bacterium]
MASINSRLLVLPALILILAGTLSAQSGEIPEIGNIERTLGLSTLSAAERREAYIRMAGLYMLSGNIDTAARAWREAALADPENRDDRCFLESALCYLTLGEFDAAADALKGILAGGRDTAAIRDAHYTAALIEAFRGGGAGALYALLGKPEFQEYRPAIYYTFWRLFGDGAYKAQILSEFPKSPEAGIVKNEEAIAVSSNTAGNNAARVSALIRPLWFFYPGRGNVTIGASVRSASPVPVAATASTSAGPGVLQTGIFNREENARAMAARLASRGFTADVSQKPVNGVTHWTVTVPAGENANQTMLKLKDAGFESFPVF